MINSDQEIESCRFLSDFSGKNIDSDVCSKETVSKFFEKAKVTAQKYK